MHLVATTCVYVLYVDNLFSCSKEGQRRLYEKLHVLFSCFKEGQRWFHEKLHVLLCEMASGDLPPDPCKVMQSSETAVFSCCLTFSTVFLMRLCCYSIIAFLCNLLLIIC